MSQINKILENLGGFLFRPYRQASVFLSDKKRSKSFLITFIFILYSSILLSIIMVFFILRPECIYYGIFFPNYQNFQFINLSRLDYLLILFLIGLIIYLGILFFGTGTFNYLITILISNKKFSFKHLKDYFTIIGYSILPLLIFGIFIIFWTYFIEKLYLSMTISPFIDLTLNNIILIIVIFVILIWKLVIETRINQRFFNISIYKAVIPEIIQLIGMISIMFLLNYVINSFANSFVWV
ncbi:MAG: hypothetical protein ACTSPY_14430 [Candidatus Helarchaeota archaeon]